MPAVKGKQQGGRYVGVDVTFIQSALPALLLLVLWVWLIVALFIAREERAKDETLQPVNLSALPLPSAITTTTTSNNSSATRSRSLYTCTNATKESSPGWRQRTSSGTTQQPAFLWVSTREGLISHYFQVEKLWRIVVLQHNRPLVIAPFSSTRHYKDLPMRLCDYFVFPADILCVSKTKRLQQLNLPNPMDHCSCKVLTNKTFTSLTQFAPFVSFEYFGLPAPGDEINKMLIEKADFAKEDCIAGFIDDRNGFPEPPPLRIKTLDSKRKTVDGRPCSSAAINITDENGLVTKLTRTVPIFPITAMAGRYMSLVPVMRAALGVEGVGVSLPNVPKLRPFISDATDGTPTSLTVVHWRRGDYLDGPNSRCARRLDVSVNCNTTSEFIAEVKKKCNKYRFNSGRKNIVYVATNEEDPASLQLLRKSGFKIKADIITGLERIVRESNAHYSGKVVSIEDLFPLPLPLNAADDFAIDIALVCTADNHLHFGYSNYNKFISRCRPPKEKRKRRSSSQKDAKKKKTTRKAKMTF